MYIRFMKWSSERIKNSGGMVVFVSNNSFLDGKANSGFRKSVYKEFDYIYTVNLKGNARTSGDERRKQAGNVFRDTIKVGITISFFLKTGERKSEIQYAEVGDCLKSDQKLKWLADNSLYTLSLRRIVPDEDGIWLNQTDNDFDELTPLINEENAIFGEITSGSKSHRDEWVYDFDKNCLENKIKCFIDVYNKTLKKYLDRKYTKDLNIWVDKKIKWSDDLIKHLKRRTELIYSKANTKYIIYRPFVLKFQYYDKIITERQGHFSNIFKNSNKLICFPNPKTHSMFKVLGSNKIVEYGCMPDSQCIPLYMYDDSGKRHSNITEFGLELFRDHYKNTKITDEDIFYYTYAIFNDPKYSEKYEFNLQRKFPRIPLAKNFKEWTKIGKKLYDMHVEFEDAKPYPLKRMEKNTSMNKTRLIFKKPKKDESESLKILIDNQTTLEGIPEEVLEYKFSSKCALEWILDFYKESKNRISDKSCNESQIRERFNKYKFADYKEKVIDLLQRVTTVSIETIKLRKELEKMSWGPQPNLDLSKESKVDKKIFRNTKSKSTTQKPKKSKKTKKKSKRIAKPQDTLDGAGQKRLF